MKAELKQETVFTVTVAGLEFPGMRVVSRWNRLTELTNADGEKLIISGEAPGFADAFLEIFGDVFGGGARKKDDVAVLMGSPKLLKQILEASSAAATAAAASTAPIPSEQP